MNILAKCPRCDAGLPVSAAESLRNITCGRCRQVIPLAVTEALREDRAVDRCPVCTGAEFYTRKDFSPKVGLTVVLIGATISAGFYWFGLDLIAYGILVAAVLIDLVVFQLLGEVTVCYRCHSEFRGKYRRSAPGFDLHTADVLEQEYERRIGRR